MPLNVRRCSLVSRGLRVTQKKVLCSSEPRRGSTLASVLSGSEADEEQTSFYPELDSFVN